MHISRCQLWKLSAIAAGGFMISCTQQVSGDGFSGIGSSSSHLTAEDRLAACAQDPRVLAGLVTKEICAGADIFFRETFDGNGRTCGTCHRVDDNYTIDAPFIATLDPSDPLFVFEQNPDLDLLESSDLRAFGGVRENVDGFEDIEHKFVSRAVPHTLSMATSIAPDPDDGTTIPPVERTGWSGDGAPGTGSLREFLTGAVVQHYPKTLARVPGVDFRLPTDQELDLTLAFQLSLGRMNDLDLTQVNLFDAGANEGRLAFLDPMRGRCNVCHANAGANAQTTGLNRNFDTGTRLAPTFANPFDGGFGGQGLTEPNIDVVNAGFLNGFGDGTFNTPPLIEAVDTPPFFHTNAFGNTIEAAISFYNLPFFANSPAGQQLTAQFGAPLVLTNEDLINIGRFLRTLNAALNLDIAKQRLRGALTLVSQFHDQGLDIQLRLLDLAEEDIGDALKDLADGVPVQPFYPVAQDRLGLAKSEMAAARSSMTYAERSGHISNAVSRVENARDQFGANINYRIGEGTLMF